VAGEDFDPSFFDEKIISLKLDNLQIIIPDIEISKTI
jgi:hypothetical protein